MFERMARKQSVRALCGIPIRHFKTLTAMHAIAWTLLLNPAFRWIYMTYGDLYAQTRGREIRALCKRLGVAVQPGHGTVKEWRTTAGGGVYVMSAQSSGLGQDVDGLLVDDPFAGQESADRAADRDRVDETVEFYTARLSRGGSTMVMMSRFHPDDAIGRRLQRQAVIWEYLHERAINSPTATPEQDPDELPDARAFAPAVMTLEELRAKRASLRERDPAERVWWSQFQNQPRADSGELFRAPARYVTLPTEPGWRDVMGIDLAYTTTRYSDWFALVLLRFWGPRAYVRKVERLKADPSKLEMVIRAAWEWNGARCPVFSYIGANERVALTYFAEHGVQVNALPARRDKLYRARRTIDMWNDGRILVPQGAQWEPFLGRIAAFRGVDGDADDEIDGLVSAVDGAMWSPSSSPTTTLGTRRI